MSKHDLSGYNGGPDALTKHMDAEALAELAALREEPLHPDLAEYVEDHELFGSMLRHPLVYVIPLSLPGLANKAYAHKRQALARAEEEHDWHQCVFLHERAYRLDALIDYVTGRDEDGRPVTLNQQTPEEVLDLVASVWVDSENISQKMDEWRALFGTGREIWLGDRDERLAFLKLPDPIHAYRAGIDDGDWSWTTQYKTAEFFARRFQKPNEPPVPVVSRMIPKSQCFGYLTRRGEAELLVRHDA